MMHFVVFIVNADVAHESIAHIVLNNNLKVFIIIIQYVVGFHNHSLSLRQNYLSSAQVKFATTLDHFVSGK